MNQVQELLTVNDFVRRLNENTSRPIGRNMVYEMIQEPGFPSVKIGRRWFVLAEKVNEWLDQKAGDLAKNEEAAEGNLKLTQIMEESK